MDMFEWTLFYTQLEISARETKERLKKQPGATVCGVCDAPQLGTMCERCKVKKDCYGYGGLCCQCCEITASEIDWDKIPFVEDEEC